MKLLGLDVGDRRVGVAFGETNLRLATPINVIVRGTLDQDVRRLEKLVKEYEPDRLIVGLPKNIDGSVGGQADSTVSYAEQLGQAVHLPVIFWDERLSTMEATRRTLEAGGHGRKPRRALDAIAALVILQDYMDAQESRTKTDE